MVLLTKIDDHTPASSDVMGFEKLPSLKGANRRVHIPTLFGLGIFPDDTIPLYTRLSAHESSSWRRPVFVIGTLFFIGLLVYSIPLSWNIPSTRSPQVTRNPAYLITAEHGAVATENKRCSDIGVSVLQDGGNAVDAAISASLCIGVVNMFSAGIGGGGIMTVRIPPNEPSGSSEVFTVDFRETAPELANTTMFTNDPSAAKYGGLSVGVPGELRGFEEAHRRWGRLPWSRLVRPSVELAAQWNVDVELARRIKICADLMLHDNDWSAIFAPDGRLLLQGEIIRRTNYSRTLDTIANEGPGAFYKGTIADSIVRKVQETGGILTHADLEKYTVKVEHALEGTYHDKKVYTSQVPTSGPVLLHILNLLERFDLVGEGRTPLNVHRLVEAMKFGFAARTRIGDLSPRTSERARIAEISTKAFADLVAINLTDDRTHPPEYYNPVFDIETDHGTSHVSVVDEDSMTVALTSTVNFSFGSRVLDPETGTILNNEMDDFSIPGAPNENGLWPSPYNYPEPGKRPLSSMTPTILEHANGSLSVVVGGAGGTQIFPAVIQTLLNLDWGMDASQAVEYGRVHHQLYPKLVRADNILPAPVLDGLRKRGHNVEVLDINRIAAEVLAIVSENGKLYAASDSRKNGIAAGY